MQLQTPQFDQDSFEFREAASNPAANADAARKYRAPPIASTLEVFIMSVTKISSGVKITNSEITGNTQIGSDTLIDNKGAIEDGNIERNVHLYPGGPTWVDKAFDPNLSEQIPPERPSRLKAIWVWSKDKLFGPLIVGLLLLVAGALLKLVL